MAVLDQAERPTATAHPRSMAWAPALDAALVGPAMVQAEAAQAMPKRVLLVVHTAAARAATQVKRTAV